MVRRELSREELFALVWEKPTRDIAREFDLSDVAIGKLCTRLQVPKPPRGYWARIQAGQTPNRPALAAFRAEVEDKRRDLARMRAVESLSKLQRQFYEAALSELKDRGIDVQTTQHGGRRLSDLDRDLAAQILLLIQGKAQKWVEEGRVPGRWGISIRSSVSQLVERLLPLARTQLLVFETERKRTSYTQDGPVIFMHLTAALQERIARLSGLVRDQKLQHVVMPLSAVDHSWSARYLYSPEAQFFLDGWLCISASEIWVEWSRKSWHEEEPPERHATERISLRNVMPIDFMPVTEKALSPVISAASIKPYLERLRALQDVERVYEMISNATYSVEKDVPGDILAMVDRIWFGEQRPFQAAREAFRHVEDELEHWGAALETERSTLAQSILGIAPGDIVVSERRGRLLRLSVINVSLYTSEDSVNFTIYGIRFRKDGTLGKLQEMLYLSFKEGGPELL